MIKILLFVLLIAIFSYSIASEYESLDSMKQKGCDYSLTSQQLNATVIIAALFPINELRGTRFNFNLYALTWVESFLYAIEGINRNNSILPGITLGYDVRNTCNDEQVASKHTLDFIIDKKFLQNNSRDDNQFLERYTNQNNKTIENKQCICPHDMRTTLLGVVGGARSTVSAAASYLLSTNNIPQVSYASTSPSLSEKSIYPSFLRTAPSDLQQAEAIADLLNYFNWTYVSALASDDDYGRLAIDSLRKNIKAKGTCFAIDQLFDPTFPADDMKKIIDGLKKHYTTSKVVILWCALDAALKIIKAAINSSLNEIIWIVGTETWGAEIKLVQERTKDLKVIHLRIAEYKVNSFMEHMKKLKFKSHLQNVWFSPMWVKLGYCAQNAPKVNCYDGIPFASLLPTAGHENVMASVYGLAYGLHNMLGCKTGVSCLRNLGTSTVNYTQLLSSMKQPGNDFDVPGTNMTIKFDKNGDVAVNSYKFQMILGYGKPPIQIGDWDGKKKKIRIDLNQMWEKYGNMSPDATCAYPCKTGTYRLSGLSTCCWECVPCLRNEISSTRNAKKCRKCAELERPNANHDKCIALTDNILSMSTMTGQIILSFSALGFLTALCTIILFLKYWNTPVVKSSSREMSMIQLICMLLLFSLPVLHMFPTTIPICILHTVTFGSFYTLIIAFILLKTYRLMRVFQPTRFSKISKFLKNRYQVLTSFILVLLQLLLLSVWYATHLPDITLYIDGKENRYIYHCGRHEEILLYVIVSYIMFLSIASGYMAFRARKLPSNFNEGQFIWLAMFTSCLAWITLFPLHLSATHSSKSTVFLGVNMASTFSLLLILYGYKVRIILFLPHLNSRDHFSKLAANATVTTFLKEIDPAALAAGQEPRQSSVISFDFDGMFDEYRKIKRTKSTFRGNIHFPTATRLSRRFSKKKKEFAKRRKIKARNKTLQLSKNIHLERKNMPPKSSSFDETQLSPSTISPVYYTQPVIHTTDTLTIKEQYV